MPGAIRTKKLLQAIRRVPTAWLLITANVLPIVGVLFLGWSVGEIMLLYWAESAIVGAATLVKMLVVGRWRSIPLVLGFVLHYGVFMIGHLLVVVVIFFIFGQTYGPDEYVLSRVVASFADTMPAVLTLLLSHAASFVVHFLVRRERDTATLKQLFVQPYRRIVLMHLTLLFGAILYTILGDHVWVLALAVALKIVADAVSHLRQHETRPATASNRDAPAPSA